MHGNALAHTDAHGASKLSLCAMLARVNHACRPNAYAHFNDTLGRAVVHALRDIPAGAEITISYLSAPDGDVDGHLMTRGARHMALGFVCKCQACEENAEGFEEREARRVRAGKHEMVVEECARMLGSRLLEAERDLERRYALVAVTNEEGVLRAWAEEGLGGRNLSVR